MFKSSIYADETSIKELSMIWNPLIESEGVKSYVIKELSSSNYKFYVPRELPNAELDNYSKALMEKFENGKWMSFSEMSKLEISEYMTILYLKDAIVDNIPIRDYSISNLSLSIRLSYIFDRITSYNIKLDYDSAMEVLTNDNLLKPNYYNVSHDYNKDSVREYIVYIIKTMNSSPAYKDTDEILDQILDSGLLESVQKVIDTIDKLSLMKLSYKEKSNYRSRRELIGEESASILVSMIENLSLEGSNLFSVATDLLNSLLESLIPITTDYEKYLTKPDISGLSFIEGLFSEEFSLMGIKYNIRELSMNWVSQGAELFDMYEEEDDILNLTPELTEVSLKTTNANYKLLNKEFLEKNFLNKDISTEDYQKLLDIQTRFNQLTIESTRGVSKMLNRRSFAVGKLIFYTDGNTKYIFHEKVLRDLLDTKIKLSIVNSIEPEAYEYYISELRNSKNKWHFTDDLRTEYFSLEGELLAMNPNMILRPRDYTNSSYIGNILTKEFKDWNVDEDIRIRLDDYDKILTRILNIMVVYRHSYHIPFDSNFIFEDFHNRYSHEPVLEDLSTDEYNFYLRRHFLLGFLKKEKFLPKIVASENRDIIKETFASGKSLLSLPLHTFDISFKKMYDFKLSTQDYILESSGKSAIPDSIPCTEDPKDLRKFLRENKSETAYVSNHNVAVDKERLVREIKNKKYLKENPREGILEFFHAKPELKKKSRPIGMKSVARRSLKRDIDANFKKLIKYFPGSGIGVSQRVKVKHNIKTYQNLKENRGVEGNFVISNTSDVESFSQTNPYNIKQVNYKMFNELYGLDWLHLMDDLQFHVDYLYMENNRFLKLYNYNGCENQGDANFLWTIEHSSFLSYMCYKTRKEEDIYDKRAGAILNVCSDDSSNERKLSVPRTNSLSYVEAYNIGEHTINKLVDFYRGYRFRTRPTKCSFSFYYYRYLGEIYSHKGRVLLPVKVLPKLLDRQELFLASTTEQLDKIITTAQSAMKTFHNPMIPYTYCVAGVVMEVLNRFSFVKKKNVNNLLLLFCTPAIMGGFGIPTLSNFISSMKSTEFLADFSTFCKIVRDSTLGYSDKWILTRDDPIIKIFEKSPHRKMLMNELSDILINEGCSIEVRTGLLSNSTIEVRDQILSSLSKWDYRIKELVTQSLPSYKWVEIKNKLRYNKRLAKNIKPNIRRKILYADRKHYKQILTNYSPNVRNITPMKVVGATSYFYRELRKAYFPDEKMVVPKEDFFENMFYARKVVDPEDKATSESIWAQYIKPEYKNQYIPKKLPLLYSFLEDSTLHDRSAKRLTCASLLWLLVQETCSETVLDLFSTIYTSLYGSDFVKVTRRISDLLDTNILLLVKTVLGKNEYNFVGLENLTSAVMYNSDLDVSSKGGKDYKLMEVTARNLLITVKILNKDKNNLVLNKIVCFDSKNYPISELISTRQGYHLNMTSTERDFDAAKSFFSEVERIMKLPDRNIDPLALNYINRSKNLGLGKLSSIKDFQKKYDPAISNEHVDVINQITRGFEIQSSGDLSTYAFLKNELKHSLKNMSSYYNMCMKKMVYNMITKMHESNLFEGISQLEILPFTEGLKKNIYTNDMLVELYNTIESFYKNHMNRKILKEILHSKGLLLDDNLLSSTRKLLDDVTFLTLKQNSIYNRHSLYKKEENIELLDMSSIRNIEKFLKNKCTRYLDRGYSYYRAKYKKKNRVISMINSRIQFSYFAVFDPTKAQLIADNYSKKYGEEITYINDRVYYKKSARGYWVNNLLYKYKNIWENNLSTQLTRKWRKFVLKNLSVESVTNEEGVNIGVLSSLEGPIREEKIRLIKKDLHKGINFSYSYTKTFCNRMGWEVDGHQDISNLVVSDEELEIFMNNYKGGKYKFFKDKVTDVVELTKSWVQSDINLLLNAYNTEIVFADKKIEKLMRPSAENYHTLEVVNPKLVNFVQAYNTLVALSIEPDRKLRASLAETFVTEPLYYRPSLHGDVTFARNFIRDDILLGADEVTLESISMDLNMAFRNDNAGYREISRESWEDYLEELSNDILETDTKVQEEDLFADVMVSIKSSISNSDPEVLKECDEVITNSDERLLITEIKPPVIILDDPESYELSSEEANYVQEESTYELSMDSIGESIPMRLVHDDFSEEFGLDDLSDNIDFGRNYNDMATLDSLSYEDALYQGEDFEIDF